MKKVTFLVKLYILVLAVLVIPVMGITYYNSQRMLTNVRNEIVHSTLAQQNFLRQMNQTTMQDIRRETTTLAKVFVDDIDIMNYGELIGNVEDSRKTTDMYKLMTQMLYHNENIHSICAYVDGADYIITTKNEILRFEEFKDEELLEQYGEGAYGNFPSWQARVIPDFFHKNISDRNCVATLSFFYPLKALNTSAEGFLTVNLYEEKISRILNDTDKKYRNGTNYYSFIIDADGEFVVWPQFKDISQDMAFLEAREKIIGSSSKSGYFETSAGGDKALFVYSADSGNGWYYVSHYSMNDLMENSYDLNTRSLIILLLSIAAGIFIVFFVVRKTFHPFYDLLGSIRSRADLSLENTRNEFDLVSSAYEQMVSQEQQLMEMMKKSEDQVEEIFLNDLLKGTLGRYCEADFEKHPFQHKYFVVLMMEVEDKNNFLVGFNPETRYYYKYSLFHLAAEKFTENIAMRGTLLSEMSFACLLNFNGPDYEALAGEVEKVFREMLKKAEYYGFSMSAGLGGVYTGLENIMYSSREASAALKLRIRTGRRSFHTYRELEQVQEHYFYPYESEKKILNNLELGKEREIEREIDLMTQQLADMESVSYNNVLQIFYGFLTNTMRYQYEHNLHSPYSDTDLPDYNRSISDADSIGEMGECLKAQYRQMLAESSGGSGSRDDSYVEDITSYLDGHFKEVIDFEEMGAQIGISYSYMRKLMKQEKGINLLEYINEKRLREAKRLLEETDLSVSGIAMEIGYSNVKSFIRFFKNQEGITPGEYRTKGI